MGLLGDRYNFIFLPISFLGEGLKLLKLRNLRQNCRATSIVARTRATMEVDFFAGQRFSGRRGSLTQNRQESAIFCS